MARKITGDEVHLILKIAHFIEKECGFWDDDLRQSECIAHKVREKFLVKMIEEDDDWTGSTRRRWDHHG